MFFRFFAYPRLLSELYQTSLPKELDSILASYMKIANGDPNLLRLIIPSEEVWRFFIDGDQQVDGSWAAFEHREPGYLPALYRAFQNLFDFSREVDIQYICQLHALATSDVANTNYSDDDQTRTGVFREDDCAVQFGLGFWKNRANVTLEGLYEYFERGSPLTAIKMKIDNISIIIDKYLLTYLRNRLMEVRLETTDDDVVKALWLKIAHDTSELKIVEEMSGVLPSPSVFKSDLIPPMVFKSRLAKLRFAPLFKSLGETRNHREVAEVIYSTMMKNCSLRGRGGVQFVLYSGRPFNSSANLSPAMLSLIYRYRCGIIGAKTSLEKLIIIVSFIQSCEQLHPFLDANCRTFCMLLANHLLMRHGFPPAILDNPNRFDGYSRHELVAEMIHGMQNTMNLINHGMLYGFKTSDTLKTIRSDREYFYKVVAIEEQGRERPCKRMKCP